MPEELLRYRNKYEQKVYKSEPERDPGTGAIESFRKFISKLLKTKGKGFMKFHNVVSKNSKKAIREFLPDCRDDEMKKWLIVNHRKLESLRLRWDDNSRTFELVFCLAI